MYITDLIMLEAFGMMDYGDSVENIEHRLNELPPDVAKMLQMRMAEGTATQEGYPVYDMFDFGLDGLQVEDPIVTTHKAEPDVVDSGYEVINDLAVTTTTTTTPPPVHPDTPCEGCKQGEAWWEQMSNKKLASVGAAILGLTLVVIIARSV